MRQKAILAAGLAVVMIAALAAGYIILYGSADKADDKPGTKPAKTTKSEAQAKDLKTVPPYPDSTRVFYIQEEAEKGNININIIYETAAAPEIVVAWYKEKMASLGWTVSADAGGEGGVAAITYDMSDSDSYAVVNVAQERGKTKITLMYYGAEKDA